MSKWIAVGAAAAAVAFLAGCSSSAITGTADTSGAAPATRGVLSSSAASTTVPSPSGSSAGSNSTALHLSAQLGAGLANAKTAHIALSLLVDGVLIEAHGVEKLADGKTTAFDLSESVPGAGEIRILRVGSTTYAKLPPAVAHTAKPWVVVSASSSNPVVRSLAGSLTSTQSSASIDGIADFVGAADSIEEKPMHTTNGVRTTPYDIVVDPRRLPTGNPSRSSLIAAGVTQLPVTLDIDAQGRPVRVVENVTISGKQVNTKIDITKYNQPVSITAPPASQVGSA